MKLNSYMLLRPESSGKGEDEIMGGPRLIYKYNILIRVFIDESIESQFLVIII